MTSIVTMWILTSLSLSLSLSFFLSLSVSMFIGKPRNKQELLNINKLNNLPIDIDDEVYAMLKSMSASPIDSLTAKPMDDVLATHIAHLFVRDPLVIFDDAIHLDNRAAMVSLTLFLSTILLFYSHPVFRLI